MIGSSLLMASFGFMMYSISTTYASSEIKNNGYEVTPGEIYTTGCGIVNGYAYLVDFRVNGRNAYYKVPLSKFKDYSDIWND